MLVEFEFKFLKIEYGGEIGNKQKFPQAINAKKSI